MTPDEIKAYVLKEGLPKKYYGDRFNPRPYDPARCWIEVWHHDRMGTHYQCSRKPWKDGFCKIHHPESVADRNAKSQERYNKK